MANALTLEASPTMFDELTAILQASDCKFSLMTSDSKVRGVRRMDTACYTITRDLTSVEIWAERRLGNPSMFISVIPTQKSFWRRDLSSNELAEEIVELLIEHGAYSD